MPFSLLKPTQSITTLGTTLFFIQKNTLVNLIIVDDAFLLRVKTEKEQVIFYNKNENLSIKLILTNSLFKEITVYHVVFHQHISEKIEMKHYLCFNMKSIYLFYKIKRIK